MGAPFVFRRRYAVAAPADRVVALLRDADGWPQWWPQVRSVVRESETSGLATVRSVLPVTLRLKLIREIDDPCRGVMRASISGDLDGWIEMRVRAASDDSCTVDYRQECVVARPALARAVPLLRPAMRLNHAWMMRSGMRGLARPN